MSPTGVWALSIEQARYWLLDRQIQKLQGNDLGEALFGSLGPASNERHWPLTG